MSHGDKVFGLSPTRAAVLLDYGDQHMTTAASRRRQSLPLAAEPLALRPARVGTVLLSTDDTGVYLTGYSS